MADFATLGIKVTSSGVSKTTSDLEKVESQAGKTEKSVESLQKMMNSLKKLMAVGLGIAGLSSLIQMADKMKSLSAQVKFVTNSVQEFNQVQRELFNIAQQTRGSLEATTTLYVRSSRALKDYGYSQERILGFTETLNKAMAVGGVGAQEQAAALFQLSQALGSGRLQGDEFRTIAEAAPIILDTVAEYMGKSRAEVKQLASDGKITAQVLFEAISSASKKISADFDGMPITFGQAMQQMQNSVLKWVGDMDSASGITGLLASGVSFLATNFATLAKAIGYATVAYVAYNAVSFANSFKANSGGIGVLTASFWKLTNAIRATTFAMLANPLGLFIAAVIGAAYVFDQFISDMTFGAATFDATWGDVAVGVWMDFKDAVSDAGRWLTDIFDTATKKTAELFGSTITTVSELFGQIVDVAKFVANRVIGSFDIAYQTVVLTWNNFPAAMEALGKTAINALVTVAENGINFVLEGIKTLLGYINTAANSVGMGEVFDLSGFRVELPKMNVSQEATNLKEQLKEIYGNASTRDYIGDLIGAGSEYLTGAAIRGRVDRSLSDTIGSDVDLSQGGTSPKLPSADGKIGKGKKGRGKSEVDQIRDFITAQNQKIQAEQNELKMIGLLTSEKEKLTSANQLEMEYQKLLIGLSPQYQAKLTKEYELVKRQQEELFKLKELTQTDPIAGLKDGLAKFGDSAMDVMGNVSQITQNALGGMTDSLTDFVMTGKADFKGFALSVIKNIEKMIIQMLIFKAIEAGGKAMGFDVSWMRTGKSGGGLVYAGGGIVGFDAGGFTGYGGKYEPAGIVHKGEYVLTKEATSRLGVDYLDMLNYQNRSGFASGGGVSLPTVHNQGTNQPNVSVKVINNGEPAQANVETKNGANGLEITVELLKTMEKIADNQYRKNQMNDMRAGGAFA